jgi:hypothetical protein
MKSAQILAVTGMVRVMTLVDKWFALVITAMIQLNYVVAA